MDIEKIQEFVAPSNECLNINLVRPAPRTSEKNKAKRIPVLEEPFHPEFTYPIFGEDEAIFGYRDLQLDLDFRANDCRPSLEISYKEKWKALGETKPMDLNEMLKDFLPEYVFTGAYDVEGHDPTSKDWKPPGKLLHSYKHHGKQFEVWSASLSDPVAKQIFGGMQVMVPFYIEGGTLQELDDQDWTMERWTLFLLYDVTPLKDESLSPYTIAGFATSYRLWVFPTFDILRATKSLPSPAPSNGETETWTAPLLEQDPETHLYKEPFNPLEAPSRERISQFVILPPYQGQSHGSKLYNILFNTFIKTQNIYEITVEDPNEAFDDMRDFSDIVYLRSLPAFQTLSLPSTLPPETLAKTADIPRDLILGSQETRTALRHESKIIPRQFDRMVEMHLLSTIPPLHRSTARITRKEKSSNENDRKYYFWRLALKDRLYRHNADQLSQLEKEERIEKVEAAAQNVEADYERLLKGVARRENWTPDMANGEGSSRSRIKRKRAIVEDDEDEEWEDMDEDGEESSGSKKRRV